MFHLFVLGGLTPLGLLSQHCVFFHCGCLLTLSHTARLVTLRTKLEGVVEIEFGQELEKTCSGIDMIEAAIIGSFRLLSIL